VIWSPALKRGQALEQEQEPEQELAQELEPEQEPEQELEQAREQAQERGPCYPDPLSNQLCCRPDYSFSLDNHD
jgi:hypothetical protein